MDLNKPGMKAALLEPGFCETSLTLELTAEMLMAIRITGVYKEIAIDPASGQILGRIHLAGHYDSYSWRMRLDE
jgi:hypothetical protein